MNTNIQKFIRNSSTLPKNRSISVTENKTYGRNTQTSY